MQEIDKKLNPPNLNEFKRFNKNKKMSESCKKEITKSKKAIRSEISISDWNKSKYSETKICEQLFSQCEDTIDRVNVSDFTISEFLQNYQQGNKPVIIKNIVKKWNDPSFWNWDKFYKSFKKTKFKIGEDDDEKTVRTQLKYFFEYMKKTRTILLFIYSKKTLVIKKNTAPF